MISQLILHGLTGAKDGVVRFDKLGHVTSLVGPNSSGKTSIIEALYPILEFCNQAKLKDPAKYDSLDWRAVHRAQIVFRNDSKPYRFSFRGNIIRSNTAEIDVRVIEPNHYVLAAISTDEHTFTNYASVLMRIRRAELSRLGGAIVDASKLIESLERSLAKPRSVASRGEQPETWQQRERQQDEARVDGLYRRQSDLRAQLERARASKVSVSGTPIIDDIELLKALNAICPPRPYYIPINSAQSQFLGSLKGKALTGKEATSTELYKIVVDDLSGLLDANVAVSREGSIETLTANNVEAENLSTGTKTCIGYYASLVNVEANAFLLWDEPENGLHSTRRAKLMEFLRKGYRQSLITTHSTEMCGVLDRNCEVYRLFTNPDAFTINFQTERVTARRHAFQVAQDLGLQPSAALFTANVVLWVEGPSDLLFWRYWLNASRPVHGLLEGFDYTIMMYGGSNLSYFQLDDEKEAELTGFDILSLCRYSIVIVDSDLAKDPIGPLEDSLKPRAMKIHRVMRKINETRPRSVELQFTSGREVENYLPDRAVQHAVYKLAEFSEEQVKAAALSELSVGRWQHYYDAIESHLIAHNLTWRRKGKNVAIRKSKWGKLAKVRFMRTALTCPGMTKEMLKHKGGDLVDSVISWIQSHRT